MKLASYKLIDLYRRLMIFITSEFPNAITSETDSCTMIGYAGELARIFIYQDKAHDFLRIKITTDITAEVSDTNGQDFMVSTLDEVNQIKTGIKVVMKMKPPKEFTLHKNNFNVAAVGAGQGYLADANGDVIAPVYLDLIPTNAYIHETDKINAMDANKEMAGVGQTQNKFSGRMASFFKR